MYWLCYGCRKDGLHFFCVSNLPVLSELPSYFDRLFSEKKPLQFYVQILLIAFQVHLMFRRREHLTIALVSSLSWKLIFEMYLSIDIFYISLESMQLENDLKFFLCNFLFIWFPKTNRPLCSPALRIHNNNNNNNNSLSLCTLTLHITPCERMRGDSSVSRQSQTAGTLVVSCSSTVKWTV